MMFLGVIFFMVLSFGGYWTASISPPFRCSFPGVEFPHMHTVFSWLPGWVLFSGKHSSSQLSAAHLRGTLFRFVESCLCPAHSHYLDLSGLQLTGVLDLAWFCFSVLCPGNSLDHKCGHLQGPPFLSSLFFGDSCPVSWKHFLGI